MVGRFLPGTELTAEVEVVQAALGVLTEPDRAGLPLSLPTEVTTLLVMTAVG